VLRPKFTLALATVAVSAALCACVEGDRASITIDYQVTPAAASALSLEPPARQRIVTAFKQIAEARGYKCHAHAKRVQELTCRGPRDMHVTFKPELNRPEFVARFNWVAWHGRTHAEFARHVSEFAHSIKQEVADAEVHTSEVSS
jgi:hypothetical protein